MLTSFRSYFKRALGLSFEPKENFSKMSTKDLNLKDLKFLLSILLLCSLVTSYKVLEICKNLSNSATLSSYTEVQIEFVNEIASLNVFGYSITLMTSVLFSFLQIVILIYFVALVFRVKISFKEISSIVSYAWIPMLISSLIVAILIYVLPSETFIFNSSIFGFFFPEYLKSTVFYEVITKIDIFYFWSLYIIYQGLKRFYNKKYLWLISILVLFVLPSIIQILSLF